MLLLNLYFGFHCEPRMIIAQLATALLQLLFLKSQIVIPLGCQGLCTRLYATGFSYFSWDVRGLWGSPINSTPLSIWALNKLRNKQRVADGSQISCLLLIMNNLAWYESQIDLIIGSRIRQTDPPGHGQCWMRAEEEPAPGGIAKTCCQLPRGRRVGLNWACPVSSSSVYHQCNSLHSLWVKGQREARRHTDGAPFTWKEISGIRTEFSSQQWHGSHWSCKTCLAWV